MGQKTKATEQNRTDLAGLLRRALVRVDIVFHTIAAVLLLIACAFILYYAFLNLFKPSLDAMIHLINDVLLALIVLELLWTVIRFLRRQLFTLGPFLAIGIIAAVRRILLVEAQTSSMIKVPTEKLFELGTSALIVIVLVIAYYLAVKAQSMEQQD